MPMVLSIFFYIAIFYLYDFQKKLYASYRFAFLTAGFLRRIVW